MQDKEYMQSILDTTKGMCDLMMHGAIESSTVNVHETFVKALCETISIQNEIYSRMSQKGWYPEKNAEAQQINALRQKYSQQA